MTVTYNQFQSEDGFKSVGFLVDENGNFSIENLSATGALRVDNVEVLTTTTLASSVINSSLTLLGTLRDLSVDATNTINLASAAGLTVTAPTTTIDTTTVTVSASGSITLTSGTTGSINNVNIGETTPGTGNFTSITATDNIFVGSQNIKAYSAAMAVALS